MIASEVPLTSSKKNTTRKIKLKLPTILPQPGVKINELPQHFNNVGENNLKLEHFIPPTKQLSKVNPAITTTGQETNSLIAEHYASLGQEVPEGERGLGAANNLTKAKELETMQASWKPLKENKPWVFPKPLTKKDRETIKLAEEEYVKKQAEELKQLDGGPEEAAPEAAPEEAAPEAAPEEAAPEETIPEAAPEAKVEEAAPEETIPEAAPEAKVEEAAPEEAPETKVEEAPETKVEEAPETKVEEAAPEAAPEEAEEEAVFPNNENIPEFMRRGGALHHAYHSGAGKKTLVIPPGMTEEDVKAAEAFKKPTDDKAIKVKKYYIDKLKIADADVFNYSTAGTGERGYVSHCAANESRQPIVLDKDEFAEMKTIYEEDDDIEFVVYPDEASSRKFPKRQPKADENLSGLIDSKGFPSEENKEIITLVKYGSKAKRVNYYFCPRLFCVRDRLMVRYKDFKSALDRKGQSKPINSCPFCRGVLVDPDSFDKNSDRDPNMTVLQRKTRPGSETERQIYIGFLEKKKNPSGMSLPCCFADPNERFTSDNNEEFIRLGLRPINKAEGKRTVAVKPLVQQNAPPAPKPGATSSESAPISPDELAEAQAQPLADAIMGKRVVKIKRPKTVPIAPLTIVAEESEEDLNGLDQGQELGQEQGQETVPPALDSSYEPDFFRVIQGVSVKIIVDASRIPLEIVIPKPGVVSDPKSGPQIGLLPEALDIYFEQDSTSDKFAARDIVRKLKPTAKGFLRLGVDNTDLNRSFLSALVPILFDKGNARKVVETYLDNSITPKRFLQINSGNLVHEFFKKCQTKKQNEMRAWASEQLGVDKLSSTNIPAIERIMNSYECFKDFMDDHEQRKDYHLLYQILAEPGFAFKRGLLLIILEVSIEEVTVKKGDKIEFKKEIKFEKVKYPPYPITEEQKQSNLAFLVHYTKVTREKYNPEKKIYKNYGWEPLIYVDGVTTATGSRHRPKMFFQQSERPWPAIIEKRYQEFLDNCSNKRGPFTSQFGFDPYSLIGASSLIKGITVTQPNAIIRDSYNHMVGVAYKVDDSSEMISVPVSDDGSMHLNRNTFFDWDDFKPAAADVIVDFYRKIIMDKFKPFSMAYAPRRLRTQDGEVVGVELRNKFVIPAKAPEATPEGLDEPLQIDMFEWDNNKTIAYDSRTREEAFEHAGIKDPMQGKYIKLESSSIQDEIEDVYQHLRLSFASWLARPSAGKEIREKLEQILKRNDLPLFEKRKRLDILLEAKVTGWLEPKKEGEVTELEFLRVDCITQSESTCSGRCKWSSSSSASSSASSASAQGQGQNKCSIHTPASISPNGSVINVPRMLYLRLVDELIRYASRREEIFARRVPRLTIRQEAQRIGDQYIIPEGSADWKSWWELLRSEWIATETEGAKTFEDQFEPVPSI